MKPSDDLYQLIHVLTKAEKRYFRIFAGMRAEENDKHYLELFDFLLAMPTYDAAALEAKWGSERGHRLAADKHYLFDHILKAMRLLNAESNLRNRSQSALLDSIFLYNKALFPQSRKLLDKSKKLASKIEYYGALVEIMQMERLLIKRFRTSNRKEWLDEAMDEKKVVMDDLVNLLHCHDIYDRVLWAAQEDFSPNPSEDLHEVETKLAQLMEQPDTASKLFRAKHLLLQTQATYQRLLQNPEAALTWTRKLMQHWESNADMIKEEAFKYQLILCNYLGFCCKVNDFSDFENVLQSLKTYKGTSLHEQFEIYQNLHYYDLLYILNAGQFVQGKVRLPEIEAWFQQARKSLNLGREFAFRYNFAILSFLLEDSKRALYWVNDILNDGSAEVRIDAQRLARIMQLILHYERGNWDTFDALIRSARRYLKQNSRESLGERALIDLLRKLRDFPTGPASSSAFTDFKLAMQRLNDPAHDTAAIIPLEIQIWVEARSRNISLVAATAAFR